MTKLFTVRTLYLAILLLCLCVNIRAASVSWGSDGRVTVSVQRQYDAVVGLALQIFSDDMVQVTGVKADMVADGQVRVYQLNRCSNKEIRELQRVQIPLSKFITRHESFWIGIREGHLYVVGSDGRGTAYGLMQLSRQAGVGATSWWSGSLVARSGIPSTPEGAETVQWPSVAQRGISLYGLQQSMLPWVEGMVRSHAVNQHLWHRLFQLMLRLHANTLWTSRHINLKGVVRQMADSFSVAVTDSVHTPHLMYDDGFGRLSIYNGKTVRGVVMSIQPPLAYMGGVSFATVRPAQLIHALRQAVRQGATQMWVARMHHPSMSAFALQTMMDAAWNTAWIDTVDVAQWIGQWYAQGIGLADNGAVGQLMRRYYTLDNALSPSALMLLPGLSRNASPIYEQMSELNPEEFGNELDRYLLLRKALAGSADSLMNTLAEPSRTAFSTLVAYPISASTAIFVSQLQAREARHIGRPVSFHHDSEALEAAVGSLLAYRRLETLNRRLTDTLLRQPLAGRIYPFIEHGSGMAAPLLPDTLSSSEIQRYAVPTVYENRLTTDGCVVRGAYDADEVSGAVELAMMGRTGRAMSLPAGAQLSYRFNQRRATSRLRFSLLPQTNGKDSVCLVITVDGSEPVRVAVGYSQNGRDAVVSALSGRMIVDIPFSISAGWHTLTLRSEGGAISVDEWMTDYDEERYYYFFPSE